MKIILQYLTIISLCLIAFPSSAKDDSQSVIKRYEKITRQNKLTAQDVQSTMMDMKLIIKESFHIDMRTILVAKDTAKLKIEIKTLGEKIDVIIDGKSGWVSGIPKYDTEIIPEEAVMQFKTLVNMTRHNYLWSNSVFFSSKMVGEVEENGRTLQVVQIIMNENIKETLHGKMKDVQFGNYFIYFDKRTGLPTYSTTNFKITHHNISIRIDFSEYKKFERTKLPSVYKITLTGMDKVLNNGIDLEMIINKIEFDYPITEGMFAKPM